MKINITNIKVNSISNIGSLNIGKTIISQNQTKDITQAPPEQDEDNALNTGPTPAEPEVDPSPPEPEVAPSPPEPQPSPTPNPEL